MINKRNKRIVYLFFTFLFGFGITWGQTAIGKREVENSTVALDFKADDFRGIILPWITEAQQVVTPAGGTLIFDSQDKKVKYYKEGTDAGWVDLSINPGEVDLSIQQSVAEKTTAVSTVIGNRTSSAAGVLVIESTTKAMVLPKMESPHLNILSPQSGTMAFDTVSKMLCIFNGSEWSFWKVQ